MHINPKIFKDLLAKRGMTQADVARRAGVSPKTIGRIKRGEEVRRNSAQRIAGVFGIDLQALANAPERVSGERAGSNQYGYSLHRMVVDLDAQTLNNLETASWRYGLPVKSILQYAPLLFCIAAELSLARRKNAAETFVSMLQDQLSAAPSTLAEVAEKARETLAREADVELESVSARKLSGPHHSGEYWSDGYEEGPNAFLKFLESLAKEADHDLEFHGCTLEDLSIYVLKPLEMWEITKRAVCSEHYLGLAEHALHEGHALLRDMPRELFSEDEAERRVMWLASHFGGAKGDLGRVDDFYAQLDRSDLDEEESPGADSPKLRATNAVFNGSVALNDIQQELFAPERANECVRWVAKHFGEDDDA